MRSLVPLTATLLLGLLALPAGATPSGLIWIPSTDVQPSGTWNLNLDAYFTPGGDDSLACHLGPTYGFGGGRAEAGLSYQAGSDDPLSLHAKYLVMPETDRRPALALGGYSFGTRRGVTDHNLLYAVFARTFSAVRLTLGYCQGNKAALGADPHMLLVGLDGYLSPDQKWWGAVDYQSGKNEFGALSAGIAYAFSDDAGLLLGYNWFNDRSRDDTVTVQVDLSF